MVYITAVHVEGIESHQNITRVKWRKPSSTVHAVATREQLIAWILGGGEARVPDGGPGVPVVVVAASPPYLRTEVDGQPTDDLLSLRRF